MTEDQLQIQVADFLQRALPAQAVFFHVANQRRTSPRQGAKFKSMGVKAGIPDLCIIWQGHAIFIELKTKNGDVKPVQRDMQLRLTLAGAVVTVCRSLDEVAEFLAGIMPMRGRVAA